MQPMAAAGVSTWMKRLAIVLVLAGVLVAIWSRGHSSKSSPAANAKSLAAGSSQPPRAIDRVTKLANLEERKALADHIARANAAHAGRREHDGGAAATHAPAPPRLPDADPQPVVDKTSIRQAMHEVIPAIAECYEKAMPTLADTHVKITASLHLTGDPDVGTLIDTDAIADDKGTPLPAAFDDCLRSTFMLMALPPLAEGDHIDVRYPFEFAPAKDEPAGH
jgi:hypothetical protein